MSNRRGLGLPPFLIFFICVLLNDEFFVDTLFVERIHSDEFFNAVDVGDQPHASGECCLHLESAYYFFKYFIGFLSKTCFYEPDFSFCAPHERCNHSRHTPLQVPYMTYMATTEKKPPDCPITEEKTLKVFDHQIHQKLATDVIGVSFDAQ